MAEKIKENCNIRKMHLDEIKTDEQLRKVMDCVLADEVGKSNEFFIDAQKMLFSACVYYLRDIRKDGTEKTLADVFITLHLSKVGVSGRYSALDEMFEAENVPKDGEAYKYYSTFERCTSAETKRMIIDALINDLGKLLA